MKGFIVPESGLGGQADSGSFSRDPETIKLRFASGVTSELKHDSVAEYLLAPVFLKFSSIFVAIIVILHERSEESAAIGFSKVLLWLGLLGSIMLCLFVFSTLCVALRKARFIKSIYTPLITLPSMVIAEFCVQSLIRYLWNWPPIESGEFLLSVSKIGVVFILMDILYGNYIAPHHPQTLHTPVTTVQGPAVAKDEPVSAEVQTPASDPETAPAAAKGLAAAKAIPKIRITETSHTMTPLKPGIRLGSEQIDIGTLVMIKAEDHYLQITTSQKSFMVREKLASVVAQLDLDTGVQVNRSCWIARSSIRSVERNAETGAVVVLAQDLKVPVARSRVSLFIDCLKRWNIDINRAMAA
jgi:DNA-binding LytR/AlgR family response regulator